MNDLEKFLDQFYSKYSPDDIPKGERRSRLINKLNEDFNGYAVQMYKKYAPDNIPNSDRLSKLRLKYSPEASSQPTTNVEANLQLDAGPISNQRASELAPIQPNVEPQELVTSEEDLKSIALKGEPTRGTLDQAGQTFMNSLTKDLPSSLMKAGAYISESLGVDNIQGKNELNFYKRLAYLPETDPDLFKSLAEEDSSFGEQWSEIRSIVDKKGNTDKDVENYLKTRKRLGEFLFEDAGKLESEADRKGLIDEISEVSASNPETIAQFFLNSVINFGRQAATAGLTGGASIYGETLGDVYGEQIQLMMEKNPDMTLREALDDSEKLETAVIAGTVGLIEKWGLDKVVGKTALKNVTKSASKIVYGALKGAAVEGGTEYVQEGIQDVLLKDVVDGFENTDDFINYIASDKFQDRIKNAAAVGAAGGFGLGGGSSAAQSFNIKDSKVEEQLPKKETTQEPDALEETELHVNEELNNTTTGDPVLDTEIDVEVNDIVNVIKEKRKEAKIAQEKIVKQEEDEQKKTEKVGKVDEKTKPKASSTPKRQPAKKQEKGTTTGARVSRKSISEPGKSVKREEVESKPPKKKEKGVEPKVTKKQDKTKIKEQGQEIDLETGEVNEVKMGRPKLSQKEITERQEKRAADKKERAKVQRINQLGNIEKRKSPKKRKDGYTNFIERYGEEFPDLAKTAQERLDKVSQIDKQKEELAKVKIKREESKKTSEEIESEKQAKIDKQDFLKKRDSFLIDLAVAEKSNKGFDEKLSEYNAYRESQGLMPATKESLRLERNYIQKEAEKKLGKKPPSKRKLIKIDDLDEAEIKEIEKELGKLDDDFLPKKGKFSLGSLFKRPVNFPRYEDSTIKALEHYVSKDKAVKYSTEQEQSDFFESILEDTELAENIKELVSMVNTLRESAGKKKLSVYSLDRAVLLGNKPVLGFFTRKSGSVVVDIRHKSGKKDSKHTLIHELIHPYTDLLIQSANHTLTSDKKGEVGHIYDQSKYLLDYLQNTLKDAVNNVNKGIIVSPLEMVISKRKITDTSQIYGLTSIYEMYSEGFSNPEFIELLLNIEDPVGSQFGNRAQGKSNTILSRLAALLHKLFKLGNIKAEGTAYGNLIEKASRLEDAYKNNKLDFDLIKIRDKSRDSGILPKIKKNKSGNLNKSVVESIATSIEVDPNINTKKDLVSYINKINKYLDKEDKISKEEINSIWNRFKVKRGESEEFSRLSSALIKSNPKNYETKKRSIHAGKKVDADAIKELKDIHTRLLNQDSEASYDKTKEIINKAAAEQRELTDNELKEINRLRFNRFNDSNPIEQARMLSEINEIVKDGKTSKDKFIAETKQRRDNFKKVALDILTKNKSKKSFKTVTFRKPGYSRKNTTREAIDSFFTKQDSWDSLLDKLSKYDIKSKAFESELNKMFGDPVANAVQQEESGKRGAMNLFQDKLLEIYGSKKNMRRGMNDSMKEAPFEFINNKGELISDNITQNQAYKKWMEYQDETLRPTFERQGLNGDFIERLEEFITPENMKWAKWQLSFYDKYYDSVNEVFRRYYGIDLPKIKKYSPINRSGEEGKDQNTILEFEHPAASIINDSVKNRKSNKSDLIWDDGNKTLTGYVAKMEHFKAFAELLGDLRSVFSDKDIRGSIDTYHGKGTKGVIDKFIQDFTRGGIYQELYVNWLDRLRTKFTVGVLGLNPTVFIKQLVSFPAYMSEMTTPEFAKGLANFIANPKQARDILMDTDLMKTRIQSGHDRDVSLAMITSAANQLKGSKNFANHMMTLVRLGDTGAIILGGWPMYKTTYDKAIKEGNSKAEAHKKAVKKFEKVTRMTQQSSYINDLSSFQRGGSWAKLFTMFLTTPMQYFRMTTVAIRNLAHGRDVKASRKKILIYNFILPFLFQWASQGFELGLSGSEDDEEQERLNKLFAARVALGSLNGIFFAGPAVQSIMNRALGERFKYHATPLGSIVDDTVDAMSAMNDLLDEDDITTEDIFGAIEELSGITSKVTGIPVGSALRVGKGIDDLATGKSTNPLRALGYSPYAIPSERLKLEEDGGKVIATPNTRRSSSTKRNRGGRSTRRTNRRR